MFPKRSSKSLVLASAVVLVFTGLLGCSPDPLQKVQVQGTVTFDGGACPERGRVTLSPLEVPDGLPMRPASGSFGTDGKYKVFSFRPGDGVVPGKYRVSISCFDPTKVSSVPSDAQIRAASYVGESFEPKELVVEAGSGTMEFDIDAPLGKPKKINN